MSYAEWCAQPWADGRHRLTDLPLPSLHPLRHGQFAVELEVVGGRISACTFDVSGSHRGDEKLLEVRDFKQGLALINRHAWLTPAFAETLYARAIERALGLVISPRAEKLRELVLLLNTAAAEAYWDAVDAQLNGAAPDLERREQIVQVFERITGARVHPTYVRIGGVAADVNTDDIASLRLLGIAAIDACIDELPTVEGEIAVTLPKVLRMPHGEYFEEIETPHGRSAIWVFAKGDKVPHRVHLRPAGLVALSGLERAAVGMSVEDFLHTLATTRLVLGEVSR